jgi:hypothetical protein
MNRRTLIPLLVAVALAGVSGLSLLRFPLVVIGQSPGMEERARQLEARATAFESRQAELDERQAELDTRQAAVESRLAEVERRAARPAPVTEPASAANAAPAAPAVPDASAGRQPGARCNPSGGSPAYTTQSRNGTSMTTTENYKGVEGLMMIQVTTMEGDLITSYSIPDWLMLAYGHNQEAILRDIDRGILKDRGPLQCSP